MSSYTGPHSSGSEIMTASYNLSSKPLGCRAASNGGAAESRLVDATLSKKYSVEEDTANSVQAQVLIASDFYDVNTKPFMPDTRSAIPLVYYPHCSSAYKEVDAACTGCKESEPMLQTMPEFWNGTSWDNRALSEWLLAQAVSNRMPEGLVDMYESVTKTSNLVLCSAQDIERFTRYAHDHMNGCRLDLSCFFDRATALRERFDTQELTSMLKMAGQLPENPRIARACACLLKTAGRKLPGFTAEQLATILRSSAQLKVHDQALTLGTLQTCTTQLASLKQETLMMVVWAAATILGEEEHCADFLQAVADHLVQQLMHGLNGDNLCLLLWSFAWANVFSHNVAAVIDAARDKLQVCSPESLAGASRRQIFAAHLWLVALDNAQHPGGPRGVLPACHPLLRACRADWTQCVAEAPITRVQWDVCNVLHSIGQQASPGGCDSEGLFSFGVDICWNTRKVVLLIAKSCRNAADHDTVFTFRALTRRGYAVAVLDEHAWFEKGGARDPRALAYLSSLLNAAVGQVAGSKLHTGLTLPLPAEGLALLGHECRALENDRVYAQRA